MNFKDIRFADNGYWASPLLVIGASCVIGLDFVPPVKITNNAHAVSK